MPLTVSVLRNAEFGDSSNGGVSSRYTTLLVMNASGPFEPREDHAHGYPVFMQQHVRGCLRLIPAEINGEGKWTPASRMFQFGGSFAACSDSRFSELCERLLGHRFYGAVAIHDRVE